MNKAPIKAVIAGNSNPDPFYIIQENGPQQRYVISLRNKERIRLLILDFIGRAKDEILIKLRDLDDRENPEDYLGALSKSTFTALFEKHEEVIFHNGYHDLMLRLPESGDYLVFDEHGLIFIYTNDDLSPFLARYEMLRSEAPAHLRARPLALFHFRGQRKTSSLHPGFGFEKRIGLVSGLLFILIKIWNKSNYIKKRRKPCN